MKKSLLFCLFFLLLGTYASAQLPGSGNTASFDNSFLSPLQLFPPVPAGTTLPVTVAAWVNLQLITGKDFYPIFSSNNNFQGTTGFFLRIRRPGFAIILEAGFGDGTNTAFRSGPLPLPVVNSGSGWFHLAAVIVDNNTIILYVNGNEMTNSFPLGNAVNMSNTGALGGFIGGQYFNGARVPFSGQIDHLNVWNTALSVTEIRQHMCSKINPATANLLYYFDFDIQPAGVLGFSSFSGAGPTIASGGAAQILSGAPIGDTSVFVYRPNNNWIGQSVALVTGTSSMQAVFNANVPEGGFHIYKVNQSPNNTNGISSNCLSNEYWGTFYAFQSSNIPPLSHVIQYRSPSAPTQAWQRLANNTPTWANQVPINIVAGGVNIPIINPRREWIFPLSSPTYNPNLAPVYNTCAFPLAISVPRPSSAVLSWSNGGGDTVQNFLGPGTYSLTVTDTLCNSTQVFSFIINSQGAFVYNPNLPDTIRRCVYPFSLSVPSFNGGTLLWSDSTTTTSIAITNPGNYSLTVNDTCAGDSVFTFVVAPANPQPITFNPNLPDTLFRCNFPFSVNVPAWPDGIFLWSDSTTGTSFVVPSHGNFSLTVTDSCGNDSVFNFVVAPSSFPPYDPLLPDTLFRCVTPFNLSVPSFQGGTLLWPDSTFGTNFFLVPELGSYELQAIDSCGNSLSYPFVVSASTSPPIPVNTPDTLFTCPGDSVIFVYTPPAGVTAVDWSNGQTGNTFSTSIPGSYTLQITDTCGAVFSKTIVVDTLSFVPPIPIITSNLGFCRDSLLIAVNVPSDFSIRWFNNSTDTFIVVNQGGVYTYELENPCGGATLYTFQVDTLSYLTTSPGLPDTLFFCDFPVWIQANPVLGGFISWPDNSSLDSFLVLAPGAFTVAWGDTCSNVFARDFFVLSSDTLSLSIDLQQQITDPCDFPIQLSLPLISGVSYLWNGALPGTTFTITQPGRYSVEAFGPCGFITRDEITLVALNQPIEIVTEVPWCPGESAILTTQLKSTTSTFEWSNGAVNEKQITVDEGGTYTVMTFEDCTEQTETFLVQHRNDCYKLYIPSAFTPNDDGKNDVFQIFGDNFDEFYVVVFNRWGQKVFETENINSSWDGTLNGDNQPGGVYNGVVRFRTAKGQFRERFFVVTLIR